MEEIGRRLRAAREAKGITLEQAEEDTKIRRKYLLALEAGREADIPGEVYVKGFLRSYANYLGLDGPALVEEYKRLKLKQAMEEKAGAAEADSGGSGFKPAETRRQARQARRFADRAADEEESSAASELRRRSRNQPSHSSSQVATGWLALALVVALVAGGAWALHRHFSGTASTTPQGEGSAASAQPADTSGSGAAETTQENGQKTESSAGSDSETLVRMEKQGEGNQGTVIFHVAAPEVEVEFDFGPGRIWLEAEADGEMQYSGVLEPGEKEPMVFKGREVQVDIGNMPGTSLVVNGVRFEEPLEGGPYELIFQAES